MDGLVVVDARYVGPSPSGIGTYVRALLDRVPALAPDLAFHFWRHPSAPSALFDAPNVSSTVVRAQANGPSTLLWPARLDRFPNEGLLHMPYNILGRGVPLPAVVTLHDVMWLEQPECCDPRPWLRPIRQAFFAAGIRRALRTAERILTVSQASADDIVRLEPSAAPRIRVTPNACGPEFRAPNDPRAAQQRASELLATDAPFFLVVGLNQPSKRHADAVRAFAAMGKPGERLVLIQRRAAGRGLDRLVRTLGVSDRVLWQPALPRRDLIALLQSACLLVHPSSAEGFGIPVLEAMACGCPVLASDIATLREVASGAAVHFPAGDLESLATAWRALADDPARRQELRAQGLQRATQFSWDRTARLTLEVYREVLEG